MRRPLIIGNWKMNTSLSDAMILATTIRNNIGELDIEVVLCPPFVWLYPVAEVLEKSPKNIHLGAQNVWFVEKGPMTGEVSPTMLKSLVKYVIIGHSERRSHFKETNELVNDKIHAALENSLVPILCVGEIKKMHSENGSVEIESDITKDLRAALENVTKDDADKIIVAYEPVWAIGTGNPATGGYASSVISKLRDIFEKKYGKEVAERVRILYGGSVDSENIKEFIFQPEIDGVLAGGSSLKAKEFIKICREAAGKE